MNRRKNRIHHHSGLHKGGLKHRHRRRWGQQAAPPPKIILVGNPNVGKSAIFGYLTGRYVEVSNYPGTSVEITTGEATLGNKKYLLIDSPGVNSLVPHSEDEEVTLKLIASPGVAGIIQVMDAKNFRRGLTLTLQLAELKIPLLVCLNLYDEALERGMRLNIAQLEHLFGIDFIPTVATEGRGLPALQKAMAHIRTPKANFTFSPRIEKILKNISAKITDNTVNQRGLALNILAAEGKIPPYLNFSPQLKSTLQNEISGLAQKLPNPPGYEIQSAYLNYIDQHKSEFLKLKAPLEHKFRQKIGSLTMHPYWGIPFVIIILLLLYEIVGVLGAGVLVDFMKNSVFGGFEAGRGFYGFLNPILMRILSPLRNFALGNFIFDFLLGEYGAISIGVTYSFAIVFPLVSLFFIFFALLEDSGYLPRLTVLSNRIFQWIGLNGRAILPMVLGLGCDTMATFTTRILETKRERTLATLLLALGIPCSAQLGVVLGMMSKISIWLMVVVILTVLSQLVMVGYAASRILPGKSAPLITEIPPIRIPQLKNILIKTYYRVKWFMKEAVPLFIISTIVLFVFDRTGFLYYLEKAVSPVITGILQLPPQSLQAFIIGFLRRDYGAAGLFRLAEAGLMDPVQITVGISVMVLFIPCLANLLVIIKERGLKTAFLISIFIFAYAIFIGAVLNQILRLII